MVLIESDWNLKMAVTGTVIVCSDRINRIRLEFKVACVFGNRFSRGVLIESDWNLKF